MEKEIQLTFHNYKLLQDSEFNLGDYNIFMVEGKNDAGKTSLVTAIQEIYGVTSLTDDPVTTGATEGHKTFKIPDKDGNMVTVKHSFDRSKAKGRFVAFDKDGTPYRQVGEIRELLGSYSRITTEQFFDKAKTAHGRREIINDYFIQFLTDTEIASLKKAQGIVAVNYDMRTDKKRSLETAELTMLNYKLTASEEEMVAKKIESDKLLKTLKADRDRVKFFDQNMRVLTERGASLKEKLQIMDENHEQLVTDVSQGLIDLRDEREELLKRVKAVEDKITESEKFMADPESDYRGIAEGVKKQIKENDEAIEAEVEKAGNADMNLTELDKRIEAGDKLMNGIAVCESKKENYGKAKQDFQDTEKEWKELDQKIEMYRGQIKQIYAGSSIPTGVQIEDDTFTLNGFEFSAEQISESKAKLVIAEIMCQVDTSPLLVMGNAAAFGKERLNELCRLAEKHNKIMFLEKVVEDIEDVRVVGVVYNKEIS